MHDQIRAAVILIGGAALCCVTPCAVSAGDTILIAPIIASASTYYNSLYAPQWMIDGSGLTGTGRDATHTNANAGYLFWHSLTDIVVANQWVEFDLGQTYDVTNALVWQMSQMGLTNRGIKDFTVRVAGTDHVFSTVSTGNRLNQATADPNTPVQEVPLVAKGVRYVRFEIQSNWGAGGIVGLSEVRFEVAPPAPSTDIVLAPAGATASSDHGTYYAPKWMIDGSGLTGTGRDATHTNANAVNLFWHSQTGVVVSAQWVEFDLGSPRDVVNALVWQLAQTNNVTRGVKAFTVKVSGNDRVFSTHTVSNLLGVATARPMAPVQVIPLPTKSTRYVRFDIHSNWGSSEGIVGLSEVRFEVAPPETNAVLRIPVTNTVSSFYTSNPKAYLIDGSGLTGSGLSATHTNGLGQTSMWLSNTGLITNEWVEFDLGCEMQLKAAAVWQYNQTRQANGDYYDFSSRGVKAMTVYTAGADKNYTEYGTVGLNRAGGTAAEPVQIVQLAAEKVRHVKFAVNSNWGDSNMVGLSEVRFLYKPSGTLVKVR